MAPTRLRRQQARSTVRIPHTGLKALGQVIIAAQQRAGTVSFMNNLSRELHIPEPLHVHSMFPVDRGDAGIGEQWNEFVGETSFGVVDLEVGVLFGCAEAELGVRLLAVVGVERCGATAGGDGFIGVGADEGDGSCGGEAGVEGEERGGVFEEDDAVRSSAAEKGSVFRAVDGDFGRLNPVRVLVFAGFVDLNSERGRGIKGVEETYQFEYTPDINIQRLLLHETLLDRIGQILTPLPRRTRHLQIHPGFHTRHNTVYPKPITHDQTLKIPLIPQDPGQQVLVIARIHAVNL